MSTQKPKFDYSRRCQFVTNRDHTCSMRPLVNQAFCSRHILPKSRKKADPNSPGVVKRIENLMRNHVLNREMYEKIMDGYSDLSLKEMADMYGPLIFASMCDLALNGQTEETKIKASMFVQERIYGRTPITLNVNAEVNQRVLQIIELPQMQQSQNNSELTDTGEILELSSGQEILEANVVDTEKLEQ